MPVEKSGQDEFDFEYGEQFGEHIEKFDPAFSKVLVRYNPDGEARDERAPARPAEPTLRLAARERSQVPVRAAGPRRPKRNWSRSAATTDRYDREVRPELMGRAIAAVQDAGIEVDIWKIEGVDHRDDAAMLSEQARSGSGRENVKCVVLGRGASTEKVDRWLQAAAPVEGFVGFAIGRSIWWDALKGFLEGGLPREQAAGQIADNYLRFTNVYEGQAVH